ncbi:uncharacterized protein [Euphorbia lathyris]|uniref:uncharacterized protein n=1 Tax=Euphorbia lathyris TaxID=212925 RepID=UPI0033140D0B
MQMKSDFGDFRFQDRRKKVDLQNMENPADIFQNMENPADIFQNMENPTDIFQHIENDSSESGLRFDLRKSLAWDSAFFDSPGILDPEEFFETLNIQLLDNISDANRQRDSESRESSRVNRISNSRKSLSWDAAFFTSAGVLDAEELAIVNIGFKRTDWIQFPGAEEESEPSNESNSAVNSGGYSLAGLEIDLFDDIRSSNRNASSNIATSTAKLGKKKGKPDTRASKKPNGSSSIQGAQIGETGSSCKSPKLFSHANPSQILPSKRPTQVKKATNSVTGKKMCLRESYNALSSSKSSLKSPSLVLSVARHDHPGPRYASADPSNPRRRIDSQMVASISSPRTPSKYPNKNKTEVANSSDTIRLFSSPKSTPYTSPGSSIDTSSLEQSCTYIKQRPNSSAVSDASKTSNCATHNHVQSCFGHEIRETKLLNPENSHPSSALRTLTPSGLRLPSPKLGYFDAGKSVGLAQIAGVKFNSGVNESANLTRNVRNRSLTESVSKSSKKDEGKMRSYEKQGMKEHGNKVREWTKENVSLGKHVHCLTQRMRAMNFRRDIVTPGPGQRK